MNQEPSRRRFLKQCMVFGGACCGILAWSPMPAAQDRPAEKKSIDPREYSCCGIPCKTACPMYKATQENDVKTKKLLYEQWEMKKHYGLDFDPDKIFCYGCKPGDKPKKPGIDTCQVRRCAMANGMEACFQCKNLAACDQEYWKTWAEQHAYAKKVQALYQAQVGAVMIDGRRRG